MNLTIEKSLIAFNLKKHDVEYWIETLQDSGERTRI